VALACRAAHRCATRLIASFDDFGWKLPVRLSRVGAPVAAPAFLCDLLGPIVRTVCDRIRISSIRHVSSP
jgi:hypothetical protein